MFGISRRRVARNNYAPILKGQGRTFSLIVDMQHVIPVCMEGFWTNLVILKIPLENLYNLKICIEKFFKTVQVSWKVLKLDFF